MYPPLPPFSSRSPLNKYFSISRASAGSGAGQVDLISAEQEFSHLPPNITNPHQGEGGGSELPSFPLEGLQGFGGRSDSWFLNHSPRLTLWGAIPSIPMATDFPRDEATGSSSPRGEFPPLMFPELSSLSLALFGSIYPPKILQKFNPWCSQPETNSWIQAGPTSV